MSVILAAWALETLRNHLVILFLIISILNMNYDHWV